MDVSPSGRQVRLEGYGYELVVVEVGGGIRTLDFEQRPIIDGYGMSEMCTGGRGQLLAPWPNRLQDGRYEWNDTSYRLALNEPERGNAIHGLVRWSAWSVAASTRQSAHLEFRLHPQPGWPWILDLRVGYQLTQSGLSVTTSIINAGPTLAGACPIGLGWHPYLAAFGDLVDGCSLTLPARMAYTSDERGLPVGLSAVVGTDLDYRSACPIGSDRLDTAFTDLERDRSGRAHVILTPPDRSGDRLGTRLWMDESFSHVMVYTGDALDEGARRRRGLAVEPMTCAPNMLRTADGRRVLQVGETFEATWGLETFRF